MKRPYFQFYPTDWRKDSALQLCSIAARCLWLEMICLMHDAEPYGHLVAAGHGIDSSGLARLVGESRKDVERWLGELSKAKVFSTTESGVIYSRRMVRDEKARIQWRGRQDKHRDVTRMSRDCHADVTPDVTAMSHRSSSSSSSSILKTLNPLSDSPQNPAAPSDVLSLPKNNGPSKLQTDATELIAFLNARTSSHFRPVKSTLKPIMARLKEGYSVAECKAVIVRRWRRWKDDPKMAEYLRPSTLFGSERFADYIGEVPPDDAVVESANGSA